MQLKKLSLNFRLGMDNPRPFSELALYQGFVFDVHAEMQDPYIQIKLAQNKYAVLSYLICPSIIPSFGNDDWRIISIEGDPVCHPLF